METPPRPYDRLHAPSWVVAAVLLFPGLTLVSVHGAREQAEERIPG